MMAFDLSDYEDVATLNKWFIANFPTGRSDISVISHDAVNGYILIQATLWRDSNDTSPAVSNIAFGSRESYIQNMKKFYCEDTATSALGRAIILLKGSDKTATKDSMKQVAQAKTFSVDRTDPLPISNEDWVKAASVTPPKAPPACCAKGNNLVTGVSKTNGKPYYGYLCLDRIKEHAIWAKQDATGAWYFPNREGE
jgi:hypothetical protein